MIKTRSREADDVGPGGEKLAGYLSHLPKDRSEQIVKELRKLYPQVTQARPQSLHAGWKTYWVTEDYKAAQKKYLETEIQHLSDGMFRILTIIAQVHSDRDFILVDSKAIFRMGKDMFFSPFAQRYFQNVIEFSGFVFMLQPC